VVDGDSMYRWDRWTGCSVLATSERVNQLANYLSHRHDDGVTNIGHHDRCSQQALERRDAAIRNTTRHDQLEVLKVRRHVEREPVRCDPID
jgi:hypothetical protein